MGGGNIDLVQDFSRILRRKKREERKGDNVGALRSTGPYIQPPVGIDIPSETTEVGMQYPVTSSSEAPEDTAQTSSLSVSSTTEQSTLPSSSETSLANGAESSSSSSSSPSTTTAATTASPTTTTEASTSTEATAARAARAAASTTAATTTEATSATEATATTEATSTAEAASTTEAISTVEATSTTEATSTIEATSTTGATTAMEATTAEAAKVQRVAEEASTSLTTATTTEATTVSATTTTQSTATATTSTGPLCYGVGECPQYPRPYAFGEWPTSYETQGSFPDGFVWGLGTASYQVEGAYREGGRGASIWDTFTGADTVGMPGGNCSYCCKAAPCVPNNGMKAPGATGNVACDHYHTWRSDIALMKSMGLKNYRFSIAWPRLVPTGKVSDGVNKQAISFYNSLIDGLVDAGITPYVTLYHWDLPQALFSPPAVEGWWSTDKGTGEPNGQIIPDWLDYVRVCFENFGDRVKWWITFNEAWTFTWLASGWGKAPGIAEYNDMNRHPYIAGHNVLMAHALAVDLYRREFQHAQGGKIGITNNCDWREPATTNPEDVGAAELSVLVSLGWFADPIFGGAGDYPEAMRRILGDKLPRFSEEEKRLVNGSSDFFGLNHYGTGWTHYTDVPGADNAHWRTTEENIVQGESKWLFGAAWGFRKLLNWVERRYHHPAIIVTENGWSVGADSFVTGKADRQRVEFYANYTSEMRKAIYEDGIDIRGYFAWSLMDNFEWEMGYVERFGTTFNDFNYGPDPHSPEGDSPKPRRGQVRTRKDSGCWLEAVWRRNALVDPRNGSFSGCAPSLSLEGSYKQHDRVGCTREITVHADGVTGRIQGKDSLLGTTCNGTNDTSWGIDVIFRGGTVVADFFAAKDFPDFRPQPGKVSGYWDEAAKLLFWGDGTVWAQEAKDLIVQ